MIRNTAWRALVAPLLILPLIGACAQGDADAPSETSDDEAAMPSEAQAPAPDDGAGSKADAVASGSITGCSDDEAQIFQCAVDGGKVISVCATSNDTGNFVQYRFGKKQQPPELSLPQKADAPVPLYARTGYSGGGEAQLIFANGDYKYVVYSRIVRTRFDGEGNEPDFQSGVMVRKGDKQQADLRCTDPADADIAVSRAGDLVTQDDSAFIYQD